MADALLAVERLCIDFRTEAGIVRAVDEVSFNIFPGEIVGLVGESGSGKTLTMLATLGLIGDPNAVVTGSVRFRGTELVGMARRSLRAIRGREIAMVFQDPMSAMNPVHGVGWQIVEQIRAHQRVSHRAARARAVELLGLMGVPAPADAFHRYPHQLSGGLRQRAMIAMALSCDPALLIADEPTTALDVTVQAQILALLDRLRREFGSSIVLITHDMGVVAELADRVMVMYAGGLVERGTVDQVLAAPAHPYTQGLLAAIPPIAGPRPHRLAAIPGAPPSPADRPPGCAFGPRCPARFDACERRPPLVRYPHEFSGGQRQRIGIARALRCAGADRLRRAGQRARRLDPGADRQPAAGPAGPRASA
jgi:peptide/nickel transport system ATP-binding protein